LYLASPVDAVAMSAKNCILKRGSRRIVVASACDMGWKTRSVSFSSVVS